MARVPGPDDPRRVLYVINDVALGGAQRVLLSQAAHLDRRRFTPEVASFELDPSGHLLDEFASARIPVHRLRGPRETPLAGWMRLHALLGRLRPAIVHTHLAAAGVMGRTAARRTGVPRVVTTLHNLSDWQEKRLGPLRWLDRHTLPLADRVVAVSDAVLHAFERALPRLSARGVTVHNGVPLEPLADRDAMRARVRAALGFAAEDFVVGSVARLDRRKGLDVLVRSVSRVAAERPEVRLLLVGDGPEREHLESLIRAHDLSGRARMTLHQADVRGHLAAMDLFAAPSRTEGLGMAIIEALASGLPVLASREGGIPEVVEDGRCGRLLAPESVGEWAAAIAHCASDRDVLAPWREGAPRVAARFTLARSAESLERVYDGLLEDAPAMAAAA
jgi:glycosyltransferase involved in cell wall biosynthesis